MVDHHRFHLEGLNDGFIAHVAANLAELEHFDDLCNPLSDVTLGVEVSLKNLVIGVIVGLQNLEGFL